MGEDSYGDASNHHIKLSFNMSRSVQYIVPIGTSCINTLSVHFSSVSGHFILFCL